MWLKMHPPIDEWYLKFRELWTDNFVKGAAERGQAPTVKSWLHQQVSCGATNGGSTWKSCYIADLHG